jgi:hypothetical protein
VGRGWIEEGGLDPDLVALASNHDPRLIYPLHAPANAHFPYDLKEMTGCLALRVHAGTVSVTESRRSRHTKLAYGEALVVTLMSLFDAEVRRVASDHTIIHIPGPR